MRNQRGKWSGSEARLGAGASRARRGPEEPQPVVSAQMQADFPSGIEREGLGHPTFHSVEIPCWRIRLSPNPERPSPSERSIASTPSSEGDRDARRSRRLGARRTSPEYRARSVSVQRSRRLRVLSTWQRWASGSGPAFAATARAIDVATVGFRKWSSVRRDCACYRRGNGGLQEVVQRSRRLRVLSTWQRRASGSGPAFAATARALDVATVGFRKYCGSRVLDPSIRRPSMAPIGVIHPP